MTTDFTGAPILIRGAGPAGAMCGRLLAQAGIPIHIEYVAPAPNGLALVSSSLLAGIPEFDLASTPQFYERIDRRLGDDDSADSVVAVGEHRIMDICDLSAPLAHGSGLAHAGPCLIIEAGAPNPRSFVSMIGDASGIPAVRESVKMTWQHSPPRAVDSWMQFNGESLDDIRATATLLQTTTRTTLIVTAPMQAIIASSIALVDVLARLMAHSVLKQLLPPTTPDTTWTRLDWIDPRPALAPGKPVQAFIGPAAGATDPVCLNRELSSARRASFVIAEAYREQRISVAGLSRLSRRSGR